MDPLSIASSQPIITEQTLRGSIEHVFYLVGTLESVENE